MVKMVSLKKTAADKAAEKKAMGEAGGNPAPRDEDLGVTVHLDHHHLTKMGLHGNMKSGDGVEFHGKGTVERSETRSTPEGDRHSASIRLHRAGVEHESERDGDEHERGEIRSELMRLHEKQESPAHEKAERKAAKSGKLTD